MFKFYKSNEEITETVIENCFKMLKERKLIKDYNLNNIISAIKNNFNYSLTLDTEDRDGITNYEIHYFNYINGQNSNIVNDKIKMEKGKHKIIIIDDSVFPNYKKTNYFVEVFKVSELMINLIDVKYCPKIQLLTKQEADKVLEDYNVLKKQLPQFEIYDPMVRYYDGRKGDIFKIFRNSIVSAVSIAYRVVV